MSKEEWLAVMSYDPFVPIKLYLLLCIELLFYPTQVRHCITVGFRTNGMEVEVTTLILLKLINLV